MLVVSDRRRLRRRAERLARAEGGRDRAAPGRRHHRRQPRGQGAAQRDRRQHRVGGRDDRASNGSVNSAHDSYTGIGGAVPLVNMMTGEVIFGGVGSGLYGMLLFVLLAVFIAGLMVGRTPEYLGKKIEAREVKLVLIGTLVVPLSCWSRPALAIATQVRATRRSTTRARRVLRDALRLHLAGQQQRLRVRRLHGLRAAERAGQRRRLRDHVRRPARRRRDALRPLRAAARRARRRRLAGRRSASRRPAPAPSAPTRPTFVVLLIGVIVHRRRPHLLPRPPARPDRPGPDRPALLTTNAPRPDHLRRRRRRPHRAARARLPAGHDRRLAGRCSRQGRRQPVERDGEVVGSSLIGQDFSASRGGGNERDPALLPAAALGDRLQRDVTSSTTSGRTARSSAATSPSKPTAYLAPRGPYTPGLERRRRPGRRGHHLGLGRRPAHLRGQRPHPGQPRRRGARDRRSTRVHELIDEQHRRARARLPRRARA